MRSVIGVMLGAESRKKMRTSRRFERGGEESSEPRGILVVKAIGLARAPAAHPALDSVQQDVERGHRLAGRFYGNRRFGRRDLLRIRVEVHLDGAAADP